MRSCVSVLLCLSLLPGEPVPTLSKDEQRVLARRNWWSFQKVVRPEVPPLAAHPVDAFLLEKIQAKSWAFAKPLPKEALLRRLTLDLTGLPPAADEIQAFLEDSSVTAYEKVVDRLMASPAYGERWALKWLDVVRYADTNGFELDAERTHAWRYRDYVIESFNRNKPYDQFLKEQIAGDELYPGNKDALVATGFLRAGPEHVVGGNQDLELNRQEALVEMTAGVSGAFLGLTLNCARCHNHKFDPILQADYYRLQAVFGATKGDEISIASKAEEERYAHVQQAHAAKLEPIKKAITEIEKPHRERLRAEKRTRLEPHLLAALNKPKEERSPEEKILAKNAEDQSNPAWDEVLAQLNPEERERRTGLRQQMHAINLDEPEPAAKAYAVAPMDKPETTYILKVGDHNSKLDPVGPGVPLVLANGFQIPEAAHGRRAALAEWLASPEHPLTARVMVNRIWQLRMGAGIVRTPNDYGTLGERPTHPQLLNWLAAEFVAQGWQVKAIDKLILMSEAYRQSAELDETKLREDPENKLYARAFRRRLEGEALRDNVLAVSGMLNPKRGGPPIKTPIEPEVYDLIFTEYEADNLWPLPKDRSEMYRRSIYLLNKRTVRLPMMANFDQPDTMTSCPVRPVSTHALQSLSMINSDFMQQQSKAFSQRLQGMPAEERVHAAHQLTLGRPARPVELQLAREFLAQGGTWNDYLLALMNRNEFLYLP
ncbi:MAG: DUF1553 domain-containing protein [Bryobacterales bacterium]|nr:DUF1553 domain-containing protein [Bryobacterales bacterium]